MNKFKAGDRVLIVRDLLAEESYERTGQSYVESYVGQKGVVIAYDSSFDLPYNIEVLSDNDLWFDGSELELILEE